MSASEQLKAVRDKLDITQAQMADLLGINRSYLAELESERRPIQDWILAKAQEVERRLRGVSLSAEDDPNDKALQGFDEFKNDLVGFTIDELSEIADYATAAMQTAPVTLMPVYQTVIKSTLKEIVRRTRVTVKQKAK